MGEINKNLIRLLGAIEKPELSLVTRFAKSPFHNSNKLIIQLLKELLVFHPEFKHKQLTKENIFRKIHSEEIKYHDGRMGLLMTQLAKLIERFFMYQEFENDEFLQRKMQGQGFWKRNFEGRYKKELEKTLVIIDSKDYQDEEYFLNQYSINEDLFFKIITPTNHNEQRLLSAIDNLNQFYLAARLKMNIEQISRKSAFSNQEDDMVSNELLSKIESKYQDNVLINIYHNIISLRTTEAYQEKLYDKTQTLFEKNNHKFKFDTNRLIYLNLSNYNIYHYGRGNIDSYAKIIDLHKIVENDNLILINNTITSISYINMASQGILEKDYDWSRNFILKYEKHLPAKDANDIKLSVLAFWYLCKGNELPKNYDSFYKVLELMRNCKIKRKDSRMTFRNKTIILRAYYDLIAHDKHYGNLLETELQNFEIQLKKEKVTSNSLVIANTNFIQYTRRLLKIKLNKTKNIQKIKQLKNELLTVRQVAGLRWVRQKIEELFPIPQSKK